MKVIKSMVLALASLLGCGRGQTLTLANEAAPKVNYKHLHAEAIGISPDASDEEAVAAHHKHMALANDLIDAANTEESEPAAMAAANAKKEEASALINTAVTEGRIAETDREAWLGKFTANFDETKTALAAVVKPAPVVNDELANAKAQAETLRKEAVELHLSNAIAAGKITLAQKGDWETKFATDFEGTKTALVNAKAVVKVAPRTGGLGTRQNDINDAALTNEKDRALKVQELVNAKTATGMAYSDAWNLVKRENPNLFEAMKQPEAKK